MKRGGERKDSRRITMSMIATISLMNPIGDGGGLPRLLSIPLLWCVPSYPVRLDYTVPPPLSQGPHCQNIRYFFQKMMLAVKGKC
jgi:hypothetical protein